MKSLRHLCKNVWGECVMTAPNVKPPLKTGVLKKNPKSKQMSQKYKVACLYAHTCTHNRPPADA